MKTTMLKAALLSLLVAGTMTAFAAGDNHFLADRHVARGVACASCHGDKAPQSGATVDVKKSCETCHGDIDKVAERTKKKGLNPDPHYNHLVGLNCLECHQGHKQPKNVCATCHFIDFKVP